MNDLSYASRNCLSAGRLGSLVTTILIATSGVLPAQNVAGRIINSQTGSGIGGAAVLVLGQRDVRVARTATAFDGRFSMKVPTPGLYRLRVEFPGYRVLITEPISIGEGAQPEHILELLPLAPVRMDTVVVEGKPRAVPWYLSDFYRRRSVGFGASLTRTEFERWWPAEPTDLVRRLQLFNVVQDPNSNSYAITNTRIRRRSCPPLVFIDGMRIGNTNEVDINARIAVEWIEAVEAYNSPAQMPVEFNATGSACGVLAFWTRR